MLRKLKMDDIGDFSLQNRKTIGKVVKIYTPNTFKIIIALDKVIFKFNCKLNNTKLTDKYDIDRILQLISPPSDINSSVYSKDISNNNNLLDVYCYNFDTDGYLLVELFDIQKKTKSINKTLIDEGILEEYNNTDRFSFISL